MKPETELRELDCFCVQEVLKLRHVPTVLEIVAGTFGYQKHGEGKGAVFVHHYGNHIKEFKPTTNPADAMVVLEKCAEKCTVTIEIETRGKGPGVMVARLNQENRQTTEDYCKVAETLPLAIAKFARQLFSA